MRYDKPELAELWRLARETIESGGRSAFSIRIEDAETASALGEVLRKPVDFPARRQISIARLDEHLRSVGPGLTEVLEAVHGRPVGLRSTEDVSAAPLRYAMRQHGLADRPWSDEWVEQVRRYGKIPHAVLPMLAERAAEVLSRMALDRRPRQWVSRYSLAGNDLDDGKPLARIVLRAAALAHGTDQQLWERSGVVPDGLSDPLLTSAGFLTVGDTLPFDEVTVCQSARLLESGFPGPLVVLNRGFTITARHLLANAHVRVHADFTPDGLRLVNDVLTWTGGEAWRMSAADYRDAVADLIARGVELPTLNIEPPPASWDPDLATIMATTGLQVTEEHVLSTLLA